MKQKYFLKPIGAAALIASLMLLPSCKKFLESRPASQLSEVDFFKTPADFEQAVIGTYSALAGVYQGNGYYSLLTDLRSDNTTELTLGAGGNQAKLDIDQFTTTPDNEHLTSFWEDSYRLVQRANNVLVHLDNAPLDAAKKDQYTGEAKALRALAYFNMVRLWGGVPLVTTTVTDINESYKVGRAAADEVYAQIISDLSDAEAKLPVNYDDANVGRVTRGAAASVLGEVYLTRKQYSEAAAQFKKVIDLSVYDLLPEQADLYKEGMQGNGEAIWLVQYKSQASGQGSNLPNHFAPQGSEGILIESGGAFGFNQPTDDIAAAYAAGDKRRAQVGDGYTDANGAFVPAKYIRSYVERETGNGYLDSGADWYVMRFANVLLMYAEALNETSGPTAEAYTALNRVRARAGLPAVSGLTKDSFRTMVWNEERLEYPFEGHRWFDLLRTGQALAVMNAKVSQPGSGTTVGISEPIQEYQLLYPIPTLVVTTSSPNIVQNPNY